MNINFQPLPSPITGQDVRLLSDALGGNTDAAHGIMGNAAAFGTLAALGTENTRRTVEARLIYLRKAHKGAREQAKAQRLVVSELLTIQDYQARAAHTAAFGRLVLALRDCESELAALIVADEAALAVLTPTPKEAQL